MNIHYFARHLVLVPLIQLLRECNGYYISHNKTIKYCKSSNSRLPLIRSDNANNPHLPHKEITSPHLQITLHLTSQHYTNPTVHPSKETSFFSSCPEKDTKTNRASAFTANKPSRVIPTHPLILCRSQTTENFRSAEEKPPCSAKRLGKEETVARRSHTRDGSKGERVRRVSRMQMRARAHIYLGATPMYFPRSFRTRAHCRRIEASPILYLSLSLRYSGDLRAN